MINYWLFKSEPTSYSFDKLKQSFQQTTSWDGVRNYQARNYLRDQSKNFDIVLFYHSNLEQPAVMGLVMVIKEGYPDATAFDPKDVHYDSKSKKEKPTWYLVDIKLVKPFRKPVTLEEIKKNTKLKNMVLVQKGSRLSIQPVTKEECEEIETMGK